MLQQKCFMEKEAEKALETSQKTFDERSFDKNLPTLEIKKDNFEKEYH